MKNPPQGQWTEADYLALDARGGRLVELVDGNLEVLPAPIIPHQFLVIFLFDALWKFVLEAKVGGYVLLAPLPVRLWKDTLREPDVIYLGPKRVKKNLRIPDGADLVMEVSEGKENRDRDLVRKRHDYAKGKIPEYWIVDAEERRVTVLSLCRGKYKIHGEFTTGEVAASNLLPGFAVNVAALFAAAEPRGEIP